MIYLREITQQDLATINRWRHDREIISELGETFRYINMETEAQWLQDYCQHRHQQIRLAICKQDNDQHIGNVYLLNINRIVRSAEFHIFIGETGCQGRGYGKQATLQCLQHGFFDQNLNRISLKVLTTNKRAIKMYEKCGFVQEGIAKQSTFKNGQYVDLLQMALLREDYQ